MFSNRLPLDLHTNALTDLLRAKRAAGIEVLDLTESNPTHAEIAYPEGFLDALADRRAVLYEPESFGLRAARKTIAAEYGVAYDRVAMAASTSEAYSWLFKLLCNPGDDVLVPRPSYPLFDFLASLECVEIRHYPLFYDFGWFIDFHALLGALTARTRAIVLVNPNNPTGHFLRRHELQELIAICAKRGIAIISDEVFADYRIAPDPEAVLTLRGVGEVLTFCLNGLSKTVGLPQMKLAWILTSGPEAVVAEALQRLELIADTYLSAGTPVQLALPTLLGLRASVQGQILERARKNLAELECLRVEAGWYAIIRLADELALLREHNILVQPGYFYDFERSGGGVVSLLTPPEIFARALTRLGAKRDAGMRS